MKITVNIETTDPADLIRVANALAGVMPDPAQPAAERATASRRSTKTESPAAQQATAPSSAPDTPPAATSQTSVTGPTATTAASPSDVTVTEADLVAAANAAVAKIGPSGPAKVKEWIAANFQKDNGSAGTLKLTRADQRPVLLKGLQEIGQGVKAI
ncbi:MAG: hypothetical protein ABFD65_13905 [Candidatus Polarisedimenticolia bacterium]